MVIGTDHMGRCNLNYYHDVPCQIITQSHMFLWIDMITPHGHTLVLIGVRFMVFNATFNNISVISLRSVLLVEETGVSGENYRSTGNPWHTVVSSNEIRTNNVSGDKH